MLRILDLERSLTVPSKGGPPGTRGKGDFTLHLAKQLPPVRGTSDAEFGRASEADIDTLRRMVRLEGEGSGFLIGDTRQNDGLLHGARGFMEGLRRKDIPVAPEEPIRRRPLSIGRSGGIEETFALGATDEPEHQEIADGRNRFSNLDCYEFVAAVLEENGIRYYGKEGVGEALIRKAKAEHKSENHFLTGEGLTRLLSSGAVTVKVNNTSRQDVWGEIEPHLRPGAILSFSAPRSGHTGIVSVKDGSWMFIHSSGNLGDKRSYRLKEENLAEEIESWIAKAERQGGGLSITVGQVDRGMAEAYAKKEVLNSVRLARKGINLFA